MNSARHDLIYVCKKIIGIVEICTIIVTNIDVFHKLLGMTSKVSAFF